MSSPDQSVVLPYAVEATLNDRALRLVQWFVLTWGLVVTIRHVLYWMPALFWEQPQLIRFPLALLEVAGYIVCAVSVTTRLRSTQRALLVAGCGIASASLLIVLALTAVTADPQRGVFRGAWTVWSAVGPLVVPGVGLVSALRAKAGAPSTP